jgi:hypothetical protein
VQNGSGGGWGGWEHLVRRFLSSHSVTIAGNGEVERADGSDGMERWA